MKKYILLCVTKNKNTLNQFQNFWVLGMQLRIVFMRVLKVMRDLLNRLKKAGDAPPQPKRYIQEKELFHFFVNGYSTLESFCYAL